MMLQFFPYYEGRPNPWVAQPEQVAKFETVFVANEKEKSHQYFDSDL